MKQKQSALIDKVVIPINLNTSENNISLSPRRYDLRKKPDGTVIDKFGKQIQKMPFESYMRLNATNGSPLVKDNFQSFNSSKQSLSITKNARIFQHVDLTNNEVDRQNWKKPE